jgi:hypothetical protein
VLTEVSQQRLAFAYPYKGIPSETHGCARLQRAPREVNVFGTGQCERLVPAAEAKQQLSTRRHRSPRSERPEAQCQSWPIGHYRLTRSQAWTFTDKDRPRDNIVAPRRSAQR